MDTSDSMKGKIYELIPKIMGDIGTIKKGKTNTQGYAFKYRGIDDIYNALNVPLAKHGVFYTTNIASIEKETRVTTNRSGNEVLMTCVYMKCGFNFYADDGSCITTYSMSSAYDYSDKAYNKAMSMCLKYAIMQMFCIPTEDIADADKESPEIRGCKPKDSAPQREMEDKPSQQDDKPSSTEDIKKIRDDHAKMASKLFAELGRTVRKVKEEWLVQNFKKKPQDMTVKDWEKCITMLQKEINSKKK